MIRVMEEDPRSAVAAALIAELSAELAAAYPEYGGDGSGAFKPDDVLMPKAAFVVAWRGDEAVGCGALRPMNHPGVGEVKRMYVRPVARGVGISRLVLAALEDRAREFGYRALRLETAIRQPQAIGLYESSGYQRIDCYGTHTDRQLSVCYEKVL
jgi:GNAT superfamily N-acetyltransferase